MKEGRIVASNIPKRIRQIMRPVKLVAAAVAAVQILQAVKLNMTQYFTAIATGISWGVPDMTIFHQTHPGRR